MTKTWKPSRRVLLSGVGASAALSFDARRARVFAQGAGTIKVGVLNTFSKTPGIFGETALRGIEVYLDEHGGKIADRKVELIREDDEFNPQVALQKLRKLVDSDKVHVVLGPLGSHIATAMAGYMKQAGTPWLITGAGASTLTKLRIPNLYRATLSNWQVAHPMGTWSAAHDVKDVVLIGSDFLAGHEVMDAFKETFTNGGGKVVKEIYPPIGTNDFSAYLSDIGASKTTAVYGFLVGSEAGRFVKQFQQFGLKGKVKLLGFQPLLDSDTFPLQGTSAVGGLSTSIYCETLDTPENKRFVELYAKKSKELPGIMTEAAYTAVRIVDDAAKAVGGKIEDVAAFCEAVGKTNIVAPRGPVNFDPDTHQAIQNVYVREVIEQDGKIVNKVIDVVPKVGDMPANKA
jgi:branched-chain amino acid transport system substrate-binding protein